MGSVDELNGAPAVTLITTEVATRRNEPRDTPKILGLLTQIRVVSPSAGHEDAVSESVWNPEQLLDYPSKQYTHAFIDECHEKERP